MSVVHLPQPKSVVEIVRVRQRNHDRATEAKRAAWWSRLLSAQSGPEGQPGLEAVQRLELTLRGRR